MTSTIVVETGSSRVSCTGLAVVVPGCEVDILPVTGGEGMLRVVNEADAGIPGDAAGNT